MQDKIGRQCHEWAKFRIAYYFFAYLRNEPFYVGIEKFSRHRTSIVINLFKKFLERLTINEQLHLPKIKGIATRFHRYFSGKIKTVTIRRTPCHQYFASILVEDDRALKSGLDRPKLIPSN